MVVIANKYS